MHGRHLRPVPAVALRPGPVPQAVPDIAGQAACVWRDAGAAAHIGVNKAPPTKKETDVDIIPSTSRPAPVSCTPYPAGKNTTLAMTVNDLTVLVIARRLHDEKCRDRTGCGRRDGHALDSFEVGVRKTLGAIVDARAAQEI